MKSDDAVIWWYRAACQMEVERADGVPINSKGRP